MTSDSGDRPPAPLSYRASGVDIDAGNEAVQRIRRLVASTRRPEQLDDIGGFAGAIGLPDGLKNPALVACTDGVGTKLLVAIAMSKHDTIGIDAVAMNVNDLVCTGAAPLFCLDYIACGSLDPVVIEAIVSGIAEGCRQSSCALLGGETAELPGLYAHGHYDVAAFAVGTVERDERLGPHRVREGDRLLALPSSGLHSNGFSLARRALLEPEFRGLSLDAPLPGGNGATVGEAMLEPTRIYVSTFASLQGLPGSPLRAAANITGGGLIDNPPRALPQGLSVELDLRDVPVPAVITAVAEAGVPRGEMLRTFNCGVGMMLVVDPERVEDVRATLPEAISIGRVVAEGGPVRFVE